MKASAVSSLSIHSAVSLACEATTRALTRILRLCSNVTFRLQAIYAVRKRASAAELPILRVVRTGRLASERSPPGAEASPAAAQQRTLVADTLVADTLVTPFNPAELDAKVMAQVGTLALSSVNTEI